MPCMLRPAPLVWDGKRPETTLFIRKHLIQLKFPTEHFTFMISGGSSWVFTLYTPYKKQTDDNKRRHSPYPFMVNCTRYVWTLFFLMNNIFNYHSLNYKLGKFQKLKVREWLAKSRGEWRVHEWSPKLLHPPLMWYNFSSKFIISD